MSSQETPSGKVIATSGTTFAISEQNGNMVAGTLDGFYSADTRFLSNLELRIGGREPSPVGVERFEYPLVSFYASAGADVNAVTPALSVVRDRSVGTGLHEDIYIMNHSAERLRSTLDLTLDADFADVFEVRRGQFRKTGRLSVESTKTKDVALVYESGKFHGEVWCSFTKKPKIDGKKVSFDVVFRPKSIWRTCVNILPVSGELPARMACVRSILRSPFGPYRRMRRAPASGRPKRVRSGPLDGELPVLQTDNPRLKDVFDRSLSDLRALQIEVLPHRFILAAGLPWFMALFGRDSIISSMQTKLLGQDLMMYTLDILSSFQATSKDEFREAEPGKIPHEIRHGELSLEEKVPHSRYYGSVDATPLFVILLSEAYRWTGKSELIKRFLPHAESALRWMDMYGDLDDDGFVEYGKRTREGLRNQGWKDSDDSVAFQDGRLAEPPIALAEVQGYVFAAKSRMAELYRVVNKEEEAERLETEARELKERFNSRFWMPREGYFAIALDAEKNRVDSIASNAGHCLWSEIVDADKAGAVVARLMMPDMFSGWGVRTLSSEMGRYNPLSYHNGSVWPHDTSLVAAGIARYGFTEEAGRIVSSILDAAMSFPSHRLPELFAGYVRRAQSSPVPYPAANSPQAWASGAILYSIETLLGVTPIGNRLLLDARPEGLAISLRGVPYKGSNLVV